MVLYQNLLILPAESKHNIRKITYSWTMVPNKQLCVERTLITIKLYKFFFIKILRSDLRKDGKKKKYSIAAIFSLIVINELRRNWTKSSQQHETNLAPKSISRLTFKKGLLVYEQITLRFIIVKNCTYSTALWEGGGGGGEKIGIKKKLNWKK